MELRLYEDAIAHLNEHINTTPLSERECFYDLITCYEGLTMYDEARKVTEQSLKSPAFANATREDLEKLHRKLYPRYYADKVEKYAQLYNVDTFLICAMILEESRFNAGSGELGRRDRTDADYARYWKGTCSTTQNPSVPNFNAQATRCEHSDGNEVYRLSQLPIQ